ncbi:MAG: serine/threonine-protein kinase, partial [Myxococcota bacterium]|nr:serine/threonine-protein kinase [Myxococcota bacterium]
MGLADDVRRLELLREQGRLSEADFEQHIAELLRAVTAASETTIVADRGQEISDQVQGGPPPAHLGAYELMELLGQGGMGSVYLAKHLLKPGLFAVKVPRPDFLRRPGFAHHFKKEAGVGLKLDHPGIVQVLDLIIDGEWAAIVMQFIAGPNLESVLRNNRGPWSHERVVELVCQVLDAMEYAHNAGVLHRDLKPKNLLLHPSGRVQVTDFGVAG